MSAQTDAAAAKRFADAYTPSDGDHPDLASRVVMYRRAADPKTGSKRAEAVHARTLMRFVGQLGLKVPKAPAKKTAAKKTASSSGS